MKVLTIIVGKVTTEEEEKLFKQSLEKLEKGDGIIVEKIEDIPSLNLDKYTHICLLPNGGEITDNYLEIINVYSKEDAIMLPLVILKNEKLQGVLNTCIWNSNLTENVGKLDFELSQKQIDLTLFGALIPTKFLVEKNFHPEIKYYQHFYFLNKITNEDVEVIGVPKILLVMSNDLSLSNIDNEEKIKYFNMAKEVETAKVVSLIK